MNDQNLKGLDTLGAGDVMVSVAPAKPCEDEPLGSTYALSPEQASFFKAQTGIDNDDDLKAHILDVQGKAYKVLPFPCIRSFTFLQPGIATLPEYEQIIKLGQERQDSGAILLDIGCCFGVDARKAATDGFPLKNIVTSDLKQEFFDMGHALFKTTPETYPISFIAGDAFDPNMLQVVPPFDGPPSTERPNLSALTSLNPLAGRCVVIFASNFFHLFSEINQLHLAKALAGLLSARPGSMICGEHAGKSQKGFIRHEFSGKEYHTFAHSPETWNAVWDGDVFAKGTVKVSVKMNPVDRGAGLVYERMQWSVALAPEKMYKHFSGLAAYRFTAWPFLGLLRSSIVTS
ncbi:hypothetical protein JVU11DRAFT_2135 [Chiua virens]|nr:hypothetical protein JVU11DRAFT_2135 [Chiua virens]